MLDMPRPRPPYLHREKTRHGKLVWVVRRHGKRRQIRAEYGTPDFDAEYRALLDGMPKREKAAHSTDSLAWLIRVIVRQRHGRGFPRRPGGSARTSSAK